MKKPDRIFGFLHIIFLRPKPISQIIIPPPYHKKRKQKPTLPFTPFPTIIGSMR